MMAKGKRLDYGLRKILELCGAERFDDDCLDRVRAYALACIGDEKSKKAAIQTKFCADVYTDLKEQKLVKEETADKMIEESRAVERSSSTGVVVASNAPASEFVIRYDHSTRTPSRFGIPEECLKVYDRVIETFQVSKRFPESVTTATGAAWIRRAITEIGAKQYEITYALGV